MDDADRAGDLAKPLGYPDTPLRGNQNVTQAVIQRQLGQYKGLVPGEFQRTAEDKLVEKQVLEEMSCTLPDSPRSTFLMVFSPDGKKVASTHGNHNVYVTDLTTGKNIQTLTGHPRTPWCIAFHPSSNQILASGCLGGQVRVWDLSGGSEVWTAESQTVIASLAFHPIDRMLVIATYNELHFWDWSQPEPFAKCSTKTDREKVRYVTFDRLGNKLITGIANQVPVQSQWDRVSSHVPVTTNSTVVTSAASGTPPVPVVAPTSERERSIAFCYRNLMNQYNQLVRRYFDLSRSRVTPTMDRGTDPMDMMDMPGTSGTSAARSADPLAGPSTRPVDPFACPSTQSTGSYSGSSTRSTDAYAGPSSQDSYVEPMAPIVMGSFALPRTSGLDSDSDNNGGPTELPDVESTSSGSGSEATTPVSSATTEINFRVRDRAVRTTTTVTSGTGNHFNPFVRVSRIDTTTPTYSWSGGVVSPREVPRDIVNPDTSRDTANRDSSRDTASDTGLYSTDLLRALLRDVASSESQSSEDTELEMAARSDSPRAVVSRADSDHPRPVPTFQLRPRLLQDPSYQLRFLTNRETFGTISSAPPSSRRMLMRPGGQFVLSRHSNSPFQPRVPLRVDGPPVTQPPATAPAIPSQASSFSPARRLLYDQVRVFLCDRIRSATEPSSADTTINYSRLAREPDADTGPDISWDSDSETLIIRPRGSSSRTHRPPVDQPPVESAATSDTAASNPNADIETTPTESSSSSARTTVHDASPSVRHSIEVLTSHIESMQRLVRARVEVLQMQDMRSAWRSMRDEIRARAVPLEQNSQDAEDVAATSTTMGSSAQSAPSSTPLDGNYEMHLRGQVRRLRSVVHELRGGSDGSVHFRDVSTMLQSASLDDTPPLPPRASHPDNNSLLPDYQKLASALAHEMLRSPSNILAQSGPSSSTAEIPPVDETTHQRLMDQLKAVVLRVAMRRLDGERAGESTECAEPQPGPSRLPSPPLPPPLPPRAPVVPRMPRLPLRWTRLGPAPRRPPGGAEATLRADGFHREQLGGWRSMAARLSSSEDRRYHRNKLRGATRDREALRARVKRTVRAMLRTRGRVGLQDLLNRGLVGLTSEGICLRYPVSEGSEGAHRRSTAPDSLLRPERIGEDRSGNGTAGQRTCRSCGLRKPSGSSLKRKGSNPQRFRADKFARDGNGDRRQQDVSPTRRLQLMVDRMQSIVRMQREAQPAGSPLSMTTEERALVNEIDEEVRHAGLPIRVECTPELLRTFRRNVAHLHAHQLLNSMIQSVSTFFGENASTMLQREIMKLYDLLHLALELTDLLLEHLQTSRGSSVSDPAIGTSSDATLPVEVPPADTTPSGSATPNPNSNPFTPDFQPLTADPLPPVVPPPSSPSLPSASASSTRTRRVSFRFPPTFITDPSPTSTPARKTDKNNERHASTSGNTGSNLPALSGSGIPLRTNRGNWRHSTGNACLSPRSGTPSDRRPSPAATSTPSSSSGITSHYYSLLGFYSNNSSGRAASGSSSSTRNESDDSTRTTSGSQLASNSGDIRDGTETDGESPRSPDSPSVAPERGRRTLGSVLRERYNRAGGSEVPERGSRAVGSDLRRFLSRDRGRSFDRLMDAHRRRQGLPPYDQGDAGDEQESPRSRRAAVVHRYHPPRLWPVARMSTGGHIIGCLRRHRNAGFMRHPPRLWRAPPSELELSDVERESAGVSAPRPPPEENAEDPPLPPMPQLTPMYRGMHWAPGRPWRVDSGTFPGVWTEATPAPTPPSDSGFTVPLVRVNDVPVSDTNTLNSPRTRAPPLPPHGEEMSRWRYYRPRFLHPRYFGPNPFDEQEADNADHPPAFYRMLNANSGHSGSVYTLDPIMITEAPVSPHHRIQAWDFSHHTIPDISDRELNGVVGECKIHNDASVDVSSDGQLLVTLLPSGRLSVTTMLGVYSLEWSTLGQLLYKTGFDQNAVSVSLSPTARHLLVGLASRPLALRDRDRTNMAQIFRLGGAHALPAGSWHSGRGVLQLVRDLEQTREMNVMSLNCIRWAPGPGHGLVYGTNTGQLKILR